ncbi:MAG TPA: PGPGW domain-containing protein [Verrucomicrobiae bacterium]|nr:PGPGW domain-containing protein [Verrucomicrobiae bacterium]
MAWARTKDISQKFNRALKLDQLSNPVRRILIGILGGLVLLVGIAMIILPGPAIVVIPLGLAILSTEFAWARRLREKARERFKKLKTRFRKKSTERR